MAFFCESSPVSIENPSESEFNLQNHRVGVETSDPRVLLLNLSSIRTRMESVQNFLHESVLCNAPISKNQMEMVSSEISTAIEQLIVNGTALVSHSQSSTPFFTSPEPSPVSLLSPTSETDLEVFDAEEMVKEPQYGDQDLEIVELNAMELLAEQIHFCEICGKGFRRDANLRMHMRAHGNQFKTPEALAKPGKIISGEPKRRKIRFSCPYIGCIRNKKNEKFRPLKSVICVKNHFKRSHCPKMFSCNRCNKKCFAVLADLKSHLKHCGEAKWKCCCGMSFSRKDKLLGHMAMSEGHFPAANNFCADKKGKSVIYTEEDIDEEEDEEEEEEDDDKVNLMKGTIRGDQFISESSNEETDVFKGLLYGFGSNEGYSLQDVLGSPPGLDFS